MQPPHTPSFVRYAQRQARVAWNAYDKYLSSGDTHAAAKIVNYAVAWENAAQAMIDEWQAAGGDDAAAVRLDLDPDAVFRECTASAPSLWRMLEAQSAQAAQDADYRDLQATYADLLQF